MRTAQVIKDTLELTMLYPENEDDMAEITANRVAKGRADLSRYELERIVAQDNFIGFDEREFFPWVSAEFPTRTTVIRSPRP